MFTAYPVAAQEIETLLGRGYLDLGFPADQIYLPILCEIDDFNLDGRPDLLLVEPWDRDAWVALGEEGGDFALGEKTSLSSTFSGGITAAQLDADADADVEFVFRRQSQDGLYFVGNDKDESFEDVDGSGYFTAYDGQFGSSVHAADLDGDGVSEVVFNSSGGRVFVRWSSRDPDHRYEEIVLEDLGEENALYEPRDYDGDGDLDLLIFSKDIGGFYLVEGIGAKAMGTRRLIPRPYWQISGQNLPVFAQLDSDPAMDLIVANPSEGTVRIDLNFATEAFESRVLDLGESVIPLHVAEDLDGNGLADMIALRNAPYEDVLGVSAAPVIVYDILGDSPRIGEEEVGIPGSDHALISTALAWNIPRLGTLDADSDGDTDIVWFGSGIRLLFTENRFGVEGVPLLGTMAYPVDSSVRHVLAFDLDGDGFDEAVVTGGSMIRIVDFQTGVSTLAAGSGSGFMAAVADLDGDGLREVVQTVDVSTEVRIFSVPGDGGLEYVDTFVLDSGESLLGLDVADFDRDGRDDLVIASYQEGAVHIVRGVEGPGLEPLFKVEGLGSSEVVRPVAIDFDGDGWPDLAIGVQDEGVIQMHRNNGDGTFTHSHDLPSRKPYWLTAADIDLDGITDLAAADYDSRVELYFLDGTGQADGHIEIYTQVSPAEIAFGDFDADGLPDLAIATTAVVFSGGPPRVWRQRSAREFEPGPILGALTAPGVAVSDVNLDGADDLLTVSTESLRLRVHYASPPPCAVDINGDGAVNFFDLSAFLQDRPDWNGDGVFSFFDLSDYLQEFFAGCP